MHLSERNAFSPGTPVCPIVFRWVLSSTSPGAHSIAYDGAAATVSLLLETPKIVLRVP